MADVTVSDLGNLTASGALLLPVSNGTTTGKVTIANINALAPVQSVAGRTGTVTLTKTDVGLSLVDNKSSVTIRSEITSGNVTAALGFTPYNNTNPSGFITNTNASVAKAWVNFNGGGTIGTNQTIRASYNVDSVYKIATGDYRINFASGTFSDANYCAVGNGGRGTNTGWYGIAQSKELPTASTFRYINYNGSNVGEDPVYAYFVFYR